MLGVGVFFRVFERPGTWFITVGFSNVFDRFLPSGPWALSAYCLGVQPASMSSIYLCVGIEFGGSLLPQGQKQAQEDTDTTNVVSWLPFLGAHSTPKAPNMS